MAISGMKDDAWIIVAGVVIRGHQVASRPSEHYPEGTIVMQIPFFIDRGLDLTGFHRGTLNISISPKTMHPVDPEYTLTGVRWTDAHPPENFSFSRCGISFRGRRYTGWIYYPHPETKERHFQDPTIVEVIAPPIDGINYGDRVELEINAKEFSISY